MEANIRSGSYTFTFVDLFAGIGGFHLALKQLGGTCVLASEIDPNCRAVYARSFPDTPLVGDIRDLTRAPDGIPDHDVLAAGFPCQPFSKSGAQLGLRDRTRGTLFFEIMEIVRAKHPRFVALENVRNLAGPRHRETWRTIVLSLRQEGYAIADEPLVLSPHLLHPDLGGAPQVRERVFILAEFVGGRSPSPLPPLVTRTAVGGWDTSRWRIEDLLDDDHTISDLEKYQLRDDEHLWLDAWNDFLRRLPREQLPGFPIWVDAFRLRPEVGSGIPDWQANFNRKNSALYREHKRWIDLWKRYWKVSSFPASRQKFEWQARSMRPDLWKLVIHLRPSGIRVKPPTYVPALVAITQTSIVGSRRRRLTPREAARLQCFPEDFDLHPNTAIAYRQLGNAVNVGVARFAVERLFQADVRSRPQQSILPLVS
jgi:DNA (cytosine-5)-methyltransferase 1